MRGATPEACASDWAAMGWPGAAVAIVLVVAAFGALCFWIWRVTR